MTNADLKLATSAESSVRRIPNSKRNQHITVNVSFDLSSLLPHLEPTVPRVSGFCHFSSHSTLTELAVQTQER